MSISIQALAEVPSRIPRDVARKLGFYVYLYVDPETGVPLYVGKGRGQRALAHLLPEQGSRAAVALRRLDKSGKHPRIDILAHGLPNQETALRIEAAVIDLYNLDGLENKVRGWHSARLGRWPLTDLIDHYAAKPVTIDEPVLMFRINRLYVPGMPADRLYQATRRAWRIGKDRERARFALAVFEGVVKEVYKILGWRAAASEPGRWEFDGEVAKRSIRSKYLGGSVESHFSRGGQNPFRYVNCHSHSSSDN